MIYFFLIFILTMIIAFFIFNFDISKLFIPKNKSKKLYPVIIFFISFICIGTFSVYSYLGYPNLSEKLIKENKLQSLDKKQKTKQKILNIKRNIKFIENKLLKNPKEPGLLLLLASNYAMLSDFESEIRILKEILNIKKTPLVQSLLAQSLLKKNDGIVDLKIKNLILHVIRENPKDEGSNYILGLYYKQIGDYENAIIIWKKLLRFLKTGSPLTSLIQNNLRQIEN